MKQIFILISVIASTLSVVAQVGIGNVVPDSSAILDLRNTNNRALLLPSIPGTPPSSPAGLVYWDNALNKMLYLESNGYNALSPWRYKFNGAISENTYFNTSGNVGIGNDSPQTKLHVTSNAGMFTLEGTNSAYIRLYPNTFTNGIKGRVGFVSTTSSELLIQNVNSGADVVVSVNNGGNLNVTGVNAKVQENGNDLLPRGSIIMWSGSSAPAGWVLCDGGTFNTDDGSTMTTPDLKGRFIVGYHPNQTDYNQPGNRSAGGGTAGKTGGVEKVTLTALQIPSHNHAKGTLATAQAGDHRHRIATACGSCTGTTAHNKTNGVAIDGNNSSTPDYDVKTTHVEEEGNHTHTINGNTADSGGGQSHENRPPYYVLAFIMKK